MTMRRISHLLKGCFFLLLIFIWSACSKEKKMDEASVKMQDFVINISNYAESLKPGFIIIPQNGIELAFNQTDVASGINENYVNAIEGMGVEELFYNGDRIEDDGRLAMLQQLKSSITIMVADYISDNANLSNAIQLNQDQGFLCFPRSSSNYNYLEIPPNPINENADSIKVLSDAKNYLYLISTDGFTSKQAMIDAIKATNYDVILIDLYFNEEILTPAEVSQLKTKANGGSRLVMSYINVGSAENWRYYWRDGWKLHHPSWLKKKYEGYEDEIWVEFWDSEWQDIIYGNDNSYIKKIINAGFDGAYLDNVEAYYFLYGK
jgi:cysteinyl-tRNA synthetase, unknown class